MSKTPTKQTIRTWVKLVRAHSVAMSKVEGALKAAKLPMLSWYDVLLELERAGNDGLRPYELEKQLLLPQYGMSRLLSRIEKAGYIERLDCAEDGRGQVVVITDSGLSIRQEMWPVYAEAVQAVIGEKLNREEAVKLFELLGKVAD